MEALPLQQADNCFHRKDSLVGRVGRCNGISGPHRIGKDRDNRLTSRKFWCSFYKLVGFLRSGSFRKQNRPDCSRKVAGNWVDRHTASAPIIIVSATCDVTLYLLRLQAWPTSRAYGSSTLRYNKESGRRLQLLPHVRNRAIVDCFALLAMTCGGLSMSLRGVQRRSNLYPPERPQNVRNAVPGLCVLGDRHRSRECFGKTRA